MELTLLPYSETYRSHCIIMVAMLSACTKATKDIHVVCTGVYGQMCPPNLWWEESNSQLWSGSGLLWSQQPILEWERVLRLASFVKVWEGMATQIAYLKLNRWLEHSHCTVWLIGQSQYYANFNTWTLVYMHVFLLQKWLETWATPTTGRKSATPPSLMKAGQWLGVML